MCVGASRACCGKRTVFWWYQSILTSVAYDLVLVSCHLVISGLNWTECVCLETAYCVPGSSRSGRPSDCWVLRVALILLTCPVNLGAAKSGRPSDFGLFRGAYKLMNCCFAYSRSPGIPPHCRFFRGTDMLMICPGGKGGGVQRVGMDPESTDLLRVPICCPGCSRSSKRPSSLWGLLQGKQGDDLPL